MSATAAAWGCQAVHFCCAPVFGCLLQAAFGGAVMKDDSIRTVKQLPAHFDDGELHLAG